MKYNFEKEDAEFIRKAVDKDLQHSLIESISKSRQATNKKGIFAFILAFVFLIVSLFFENRLYNYSLVIFICLAGLIFLLESTRLDSQIKILKILRELNRVTS